MEKAKTWVTFLSLSFTLENLSECKQITLQGWSKVVEKNEKAK